MDKSNKIQYLEGVRGTAALFVVFHHFQVSFYPSSFFGGDPTSLHLGSFELEYFRSPLSFISNGEFMVSIFFILSGFVLSRSYINSNNTEALVSLAIRRFIRLYVPVAFTLILGFIILRNSLWLGSSASQITHSGWLQNIWKSDPSYKTFIICFTYYTMFMGDNRYDTSMWTMAIELYGSMLVFSLLALTHKARNKWVIFTIVSIIAYYLFNDFYLAFVIGIGLNYINLPAIMNFKYRKILVTLLVIISLIMGGFPTWNLNYNHETFYKFVSSPIIINNTKTVHMFGAALFIIVMLISDNLQSFFSGKIFIFLGDISFSAYLLHPLVIGTFSCLIFLNTYHFTGRYNLSALIALISTIIITLILSKIMTELVDKSNVRFSKNIYTRFFKPKEIPN